MVTKIRELMLDFNLVDIWRLRNPDKKRYQWKQNKPLVQRRLVYSLISDDFQDDVDNTGIISATKQTTLLLCSRLTVLKSKQLGRHIGIGNHMRPSTLNCTRVFKFFQNFSKIGKF